MDSIVALLASVVVSMLAVSGFQSWAKLGVQNMKTAATASQLMIVDAAAQRYVRDFSQTLSAAATTSVPAVVTAQALSNLGYLPAGFSITNSFGQGWQLQVLKTSTGALQALVTSTGAPEITDTKQLVQIAAQAGAQGGFIPYPSQGGDGNLQPTSAFGAYGGWKVPMANFANPGKGHLASLLAFNGSSGNNDYLYRVAMPSQPDLNSMQTDLGMTDTGGTAHNISGANVISTQSITALSDGSIATPSVSMANGHVLAWNNVPEGGVLQLVDKSGTNVYLEAFNGTFRLVNSPYNKQLFSVDQSGNVVASGTIQPGVAIVGQGCSTPAAIAGNADGSGQLIACQRGLWLPVGGKKMWEGFYTVANGSVVPAPMCSQGGTPEIMLAPQSWATDSTGVNNFLASAVGGGWSISIIDGSGGAPGGTGAVVTFCAYQ